MNIDSTTAQKSNYSPLLRCWKKQKQFFVTDLKYNFSEWYDQSATMMGEEGAVIGGLLVGLNVIDCNICIKGGDLDVQVYFLADQN